MQESGLPEDDQPRLVRRNTLLPSRRLCPKCLSPLTARGELGGWLVPQDYFCESCGYSGTVYVESTKPTASEGGD